MRIIFFGADRWFSEPVLAAILKAGLEVPLIVTKGDAFVTPKSKIKSLSRAKSRDQKSKIIQATTANDISVERLRDAFGEIATARRGGPRNDRFTINGSRFTKDNRPEAIVLASFGPPFLPAEILNWPKYGCLNVHASLLPRWRGASPVFASLREGDKETGVSIMKMTTEIDRGPVLRQKRIKIRTPGFQTTRQKGRSLKDTPLRIIPNAVDADTRETLTKRLGLLGGELIVETLKKLETGQITEVKQPEKSPTPYTRRLTKESGRIDWSQSPIQIERFIRAVFPWPSAMSNVKFKMKNSKWQTIQNVKILKAHVERVRDFRGVSPVHENHEIKRKTRNRNEVKLVIDQVQLPGKTPITWKQFLAGHPEVKFE